MLSDKVLFPKPVTFEFVPESNRTIVQNTEQANAVKKDCILWGFCENSIVMLRSASFLGAYQMGVITYVKSSHSPDFAPLTVKWVNKTEISHHWPDELLLIHEGISDKDLIKLRETQKDPIYV